MLANLLRFLTTSQRPSMSQNSLFTLRCLILWRTHPLYTPVVSNFEINAGNALFDLKGLPSLALKRELWRSARLLLSR
jgi:hypothetical protein